MAVGSAITGGLQGIRRSVSPSAFTLNAKAVQPAEPDPVTTSLIQRNSAALSQLGNQFNSVGAQIASLNQSLTIIQQNLTSKSNIERQQAEAENQRQRQLTRLRLREGKEGEIERKIQNALMKPINKIGAKVQFGLSRLQNFFTILLSGWITMRFLDFFKAQSDGNKEKLDQIKSKLLGNLAFVGGALFLIQGGLGVVVGTLTRIGMQVLRFGLSKMIWKPIKSLIGLIGRLFGGALAKAGVPGLAKMFGGGAGALTQGLSNKNKQNIPQGGSGSQTGGVTPKKGPRFPWLAAGLQWTADVISGKDPKESAKDTGGGVVGSMLTTKALRKVLPNKLKILADIGGGVFGWMTGYQLADMINIWEKPEGDQTQQVEETGSKFGDANWASERNRNLTEEQRAILESQGGADNISPAMMSEIPEEKGNRGFLGWRSSLDWMSGGLLDLDKKGSDFNLINPKPERKFDSQNLGSVDEEAPPVITAPVGGGNGGQQASATTSGGGGNGSTPNIASSNQSNNYPYYAFREFNISAAVA